MNQIIFQFTRPVFPMGVRTRRRRKRDAGREMKGCDLKFTRLLRYAVEV
jgi:hypothetical protein